MRVRVMIIMHWSLFASTLMNSTVVRGVYDQTQSGLTCLLLVTLTLDLVTQVWSGTLGKGHVLKLAILRIGSLGVSTDYCTVYTLHA